MNELVHIKNNDIFTDSLIIAEGTDNQRESIRNLIRRYENQFKQLGKVAISNRTLYTKGGEQDGTFYELNEPQASFLITLLRNNEKVVNFKPELVKEFYRMRRIILEKSTKEWQEVQSIGKLTRKLETDTLKDFIAYAKNQGSHNADKYYIHFTKLVNASIGLDTNRNTTSYRTPQAIELLESVILKTVAEEMATGTHYKVIYQICKERIQGIAKYIDMLLSAKRDINQARTSYFNKGLVTKESWDASPSSRVSFDKSKIPMLKAAGVMKDPKDFEYGWHFPNAYYGKVNSELTAINKSIGEILNCLVLPYTQNPQLHRRRIEHI